MLKAVRNCRTWYSGYLASICCSTAREAQHGNLRDRWQHPGRIRRRRAVNHILNIRIEEALNYGRFLAHHGIEVCGDQLRVRWSWFDHKFFSRSTRPALALVISPRRSFGMRCNCGPALGDPIALEAPEHEAMKLQLLA